MSNDIKLQPASLEIYRMKYQLKDNNGKPLEHTIDESNTRVAKALASIEVGSESVFRGIFEEALRSGCIPAGRIFSNAGAMQHKKSASLINCVVSSTIKDSIPGILDCVKEAGESLASGSGIGYDFSTLRPKGSRVSGAGAKTSGALSFMDIFNTMCFTISSAGGRRGAQMATLDVRHPDVFDFIAAKRENGKFRQFNLSLLITDDFIKAVKNDDTWDLIFPINVTMVPDLVNNPRLSELVNNPELKHELDEISSECLNDNVSSKLDYYPVGDHSEYIFDNTGAVLCMVHDTIKASTLWETTMKSTYDYAEPGFILIDRVNDYNNNWWCENIRATNPCVSADTWIHTTNGPKQVRHLVGRRFTAFVDGRPHTSDEKGFFKTGEKETYIVKTKSGLKIKATEDHPLMKAEVDHTLTVVRSEWCEVKDLKVGDMLALNNHYGLRSWEGNHTRSHGEIFGHAISNNSSTSLGMIEDSSSDAHVGFLNTLFNKHAELQVTPTLHIRLDGFMLSILETIQRMLLRFGINSTIIRDEEHEETYLKISGSNLIVFNDIVKPINEFSYNVGFDSYIEDLTPELFMSEIVSITKSGIEPVYDVQIPIIHAFDANGFMAHNCGEQPLPPYGSCLLGSINLVHFVKHPFTPQAEFDFESFSEKVMIFSRMLDNVADISNLALPEQETEIKRKRRHGMGFLGLGSAMTMMCIKYGSEESLKFVNDVSRILALRSWQAGAYLAKVKGPAPIMKEQFVVTEEMLSLRPEMKLEYQLGDKVSGVDLMMKYSRYMNMILEELTKEGLHETVDILKTIGSRYTHATSIAPTGTISFSLGNNVSNGIEPSFAHSYIRNVLVEGFPTKQDVEVCSYELLAYRALVNPNASPFVTDEVNRLPDYFATSESISALDHVMVQAAAQKWIDSSISKTINVPSDYPYDDFKNIYMHAYENGLKGAATFRFNPDAFQGVLVTKSDLDNTQYQFELESGELITLKGSDKVEYNGNTSTAANLFDALKEGYYGRF